MRTPLAIRAIPSFAERAWFTPPPLSTRVREKWESDLDGTEPIQIRVRGESLDGYTVGQGPLVIFVHGWGGRASQMAMLAKAVAAKGFRSVAVNAPGHGEAYLDTTNIFEMADAIEAVVDEYGTPIAVVAHSLGSMATIHALAGSMPTRLVLLAPVLDVEEVLEVFGSRAELMPWAAASLRRRIRRFVGEHWDRFRAGPRVDLGDAEVLVVHDPDDEDTSFANSAAMAALRTRTELYVVESLGHRGPLRDPATIERVTSFLSE